MRRFTRLTNAFSKKLENHTAAVALHTMFYNFVRVHSTLKVTPAMAAGVTDRLWEISDLVTMLEAWEAAHARIEPKFEIEPNQIGDGFRADHDAERRSRNNLWLRDGSRRGQMDQARVTGLALRAEGAKGEDSQLML